LRPKSARPISFTTKSLKRVSACVATSRFSDWLMSALAGAGRASR
jgi:hypothetical protein